MDMNSFLGLSLLPILSPGPSSIVAVRNSHCHGLGFAFRRLLADGCATMLTVTLLLYGLGAVIAGNRGLLTGIQLLGAGYVLLIGLLCLGRTIRPVFDATQTGGPGGSWLEAFFAGLLNPKTLVFFTLVCQPLLSGAGFHWATPVLYALSYSLLKVVALSLACAALLLARQWLRQRLRLAHGMLGTALVATGSGLLLKISSDLLG